MPHSSRLTHATNGVTDSAAGGAALATGHKTKNGAISVLKKTSRRAGLQRCGSFAQRGGAAVGISTSVTVDHATPAVFYAHAEHRKMYYEIGKQLTTSNFDFFGGSTSIRRQTREEQFRTGSIPTS